MFLLLFVCMYDVCVCAVKKINREVVNGFGLNFRDGQQSIRSSPPPRGISPWKLEINGPYVRSTILLRSTEFGSVMLLWEGKAESIAPKPKRAGPPRA